MPQDRDGIPLISAERHYKEFKNGKMDSFADAYYFFCEGFTLFEWRMNQICCVLWLWYVTKKKNLVLGQH